MKLDACVILLAHMVLDPLRATWVGGNLESSNVSC